MRAKVDPVTIGDSKHRIVLKFLWRPEKLRNPVDGDIEVRWLEMAAIHQRSCRGYMGKVDWVNVGWVEVDEEDGEVYGMFLYEDGELKAAPKDFDRDALGRYDETLYIKVNEFKWMSSKER